MIIKDMQGYAIRAAVTDDMVEIDLRLAALAEALALWDRPDPEHMRQLAAMLRERAERRRLEISR